tara:strand:- start:4756 stop:4947 length:192 start_codon:yes stop_codon:yes gene_type:complete
MSIGSVEVHAETITVVFFFALLSDRLTYPFVTECQGRAVCIDFALVSVELTTSRDEQNKCEEE